jgi:hypothetical protein
MVFPPFLIVLSAIFIVARFVHARRYPCRLKTL